MDGRQNLVAAADFDPEPSAAAAARRFVRETLISSGLPVDDDAVSDAVLLTSELVTNAVVHAGTPVQLTCRLNGTNIEVSVLDRHPARVIPDPPGATAVVDRPSGRGLLLPAALSVVMGRDVRGLGQGGLVPPRPRCRPGRRARPGGGHRVRCRRGRCAVGDVALGAAPHHRPAPARIRRAARARRRARTRSRGRRRRLRADRRRGWRASDARRGRRRDTAAPGRR